MKILLLLLCSCALVAACSPTTPSAPSTATPTLPSATVISSTLDSRPAATAALPETRQPTILPTVTVSPSAPVTAAVTPTTGLAEAATMTQLTKGGCCVQPFWSADSQRVLFIDKPDAASPTAIYGIDVETPGAPSLFNPRIASYTSDLQYVIYFEGAFTVLEQLSDGQKWKFRTGGRGVALSPDHTRVVWNETCDTCFPIENRPTTVMLAELASATPHVVTTVLRGGASAWLDDQHLLMTGRLNRNSLATSLFVQSLADGSTKELTKSERLRGAVPAPGGQWIAYSIAFDKDPAQNGLWLVATTGDSRFRLNCFGGFAWRDDHRLLVIPIEPGAASQQLLEYDVRARETRRLTDPDRTPFMIANGDWAVAPDGKGIVFVNARDSNLWLLQLPPAPPLAAPGICN